MKVRLLRTWESLTTSFWFVPVCMATCAVLFAGLMIFIDQRQKETASPILQWLYISGPSGARALLSTIAASAITVTSIIFSLTVVTLSMASNQFGPRLLQNFMQHGRTQIAQGTFIATFIYSLLILSRIPDASADGDIPHLSVVAGLLLGVISFFVLIFFLHHVTTFIRAPRVVDDVANRLRSNLRKIFPEGLGEGPSESEDSPPSSADPAQSIVANESGYLQAIDIAGLMDLACQHNIVLRLRVRPGHFIIIGRPVAEVLRGKPGLVGEITDNFNDLLIVGPERTATQDVEFAVEQLVEVGLRALSTGINDPFTAINCIDRIGATLSLLSRRELPSAQRYDHEGKLRVIVKPYTYRGIINNAFDQLRQAARGDVAVCLRLLETIGRLGERRIPNEFREALLAQAQAIYDANKDAFAFERDRIDLEKRYSATRKLLLNNENLPAED